MRKKNLALYGVDKKTRIKFANGLQPQAQASNNPYQEQQDFISMQLEQMRRQMYASQAQIWLGRTRLPSISLPPPTINNNQKEDMKSSKNLKEGDIVFMRHEGRTDNDRYRPLVESDVTGTVLYLDGSNEIYIAWDDMRTIDSVTTSSGERPYSGRYYPYESHYGHYILREEDLPESERASTQVSVDTSILDRVVLNEDGKKEIVSAVKQLQYNKKLFEDWGLGEIIEYGRGVTMLFWGKPGTGKTQTAKLIAKSIKHDLMIIGTAELQSAVPGEYERNVKDAFKKAKQKKAVLLIDECDSMVMSREGMGQIMSAENNCLMTEIEKFEGIIILTTNRIGELDKALERRISAIVHFELPTHEQRQEIWKIHLPKKLPLHKDVKVVELADHALTGGQIKNVVLNAARIAVSNEEKHVKHEHFLTAIGRINSGKKAFAQRSSVARIARAQGSGGADIGRSSGNKEVTRTDNVDLEIKEPEIVRQETVAAQAS